jgi:hypothetical protein
VPLIGRRRPLLRAAAVGGGAYMAGKQRARSQEREAGQDARLDQVEQQQYAPPQPQYAPPPAPAPSGMGPDVIEQLKQLGALHEQGVLTDEEFTSQKTRLLA